MSRYELRSDVDLATSCTTKRTARNTQVSYVPCSVAVGDEWGMSGWVGGDDGFSGERGGWEYDLESHISGHYNSEYFEMFKPGGLDNNDLYRFQNLN